MRIAILLSLILLIGCDVTPPKHRLSIYTTDYWQLKGKVKTIDFYDITTDSLNNSTEHTMQIVFNETGLVTRIMYYNQEDKDDYTTEFYEYDKQGRIKEIKKKSEKTEAIGSGFYKIAYSYNQDNSVVREEHFKGKNLTMIAEHYYDKDYKETEQRVYGIDKNLEEVYHYSYDSNGYLGKLEKYDHNNVLLDTIKYINNSKGKLIQYITYDELGNIDQEEYTYNNNNDRITAKIRKGICPLVGYKDFSYVYEYDPKGNYTKCYVYENEKFSFIEKRVITYYE